MVERVIKYVVLGRWKLCPWMIEKNATNRNSDHTPCRRLQPASGRQKGIWMEGVENHHQTIEAVTPYGDWDDLVMTNKSVAPRVRWKGTREEGATWILFAKV